MNSQGAKLEELVEKTHQASIEDIAVKAWVSSDAERKKVAEQANHIHEEATGHSMKIDEHGNIDIGCKEAKQCPKLQ
ncbi:hypothetical protein A0J61_05371 [Choanephora cucurbitarum]|uniref:Uncharacterized protein n=1 Tax=Choanephora cucurbitarum TaxID=101091 RepID=A0A1C7NBV9_9FUNG|nr:hypothetical protein A0J61_05371 [Choanephora cucurbitarum]